MSSKTKILFILKRREDFDPLKHTKEGMQTGLFNSATFVKDMLNDNNVESKLFIAKDNNDIDREIKTFDPTHVIIEALWVVPQKFAVLSKLHPTVKWVIRLHSETPFLAQEGMAWDWLGDYIRHPNILIAANSPRMLAEVTTYLTAILPDDKTIHNRIIYLPNFYPTKYKTKHFDLDKDYIDIGCFGAVRPLKNHMVQAMAALQFAKTVDKKLRFHINARVELTSDSIVRNLRCMFQHLAEQEHELIFHTWTPRKEFLDLCSTMDIGMQVSFSETFNIVGADFISQGVPLICSNEIPWINKKFKADPTSSNEICKALIEACINPKRNVSKNQKALTTYSEVTENIWLQYFDK